MMSAVWRKLKDWERKNRERYSHDLIDPEERKKSQHYADWVDHGILRYRWHNFAQIAPNMYRSNHPNHERFEAYAKLGIKTVLNLRGASNHSPYYFEVESCKKLNLDLIDIPMSARSAPPPEKLIEVMDALETLVDIPTLMHCKSGADRTGIVSAMYLMHILGKPVEEARKMLSFDFVHIKFTKTGILDYVIDMYARRVAKSPIPFREWVETEYDHEAARDGFNNMGMWRRTKL
ncbi:tyrosine-protein phosphatase [Cognatishimia sp. 1_MG-2023]|nr:tyrosine-protein phosphatase [Cognatishimia sp. 1_MG-2023]